MMQNITVREYQVYILLKYLLIQTHINKYQGVRWEDEWGQSLKDKGQNAICSEIYTLLKSLAVVIPPIYRLSQGISPL